MTALGPIGMSELLKLNDMFARAQALLGYFDTRLLVFLIVPFSALAYQYWGLTGLVGSAFVLPITHRFLRSIDTLHPAQGHIDGLTGVYTAAEVDRLCKSWPRALVNGHKSAACLMISVAGFDALCSRYGETAGFQIQRSMANRLTRILRSNDLISRTGNATFMAMIAPARHIDLENCIQMANRIKTALESPIMIDGTSTNVSVSIGFCLTGQTKTGTLKSLQDGAVIALSAAQKSGHSTIRAFSPALLKKHQTRQRFSDEAKQALANGEVEAWFQPQISTETGEVTGFEALARWRHPLHGVMAPGEFLDALTASGQLEQLFEEMLRQSIQALNAWELAGFTVPNVGINLSGDELHNPMLADRISWELDRYDIAASRITIEVLESVIAGAPDGVVARNLKDLSKLGCQIDLDDFGTGHAAITSVQQFSANRLKIDRSFIKGVDKNKNQQKLIAAIVTMSEQLGISTLAEGVETAAEHTLIAQMGCDHVQGFGIGHPMPFDDTLDWMRAHRAKISSLPILGKNSSEPPF